jgi:ferric-dicitrate binding protein FerR (iron transport regulator)
LGDGKKLDELVLDYLADDIADRDFVELEARLRDEPRARRRFAELSEEEVTLWQMASALEEETGAAKLAAVATAPARRAWRSRLLWAAGAAVAAAAAILVGVWFMRPPAQVGPGGDALTPAEPVIEVAAAEGRAELVADSGARPLSAGETLQPGAKLRTADGGTLKLKLPGGSDVEMRAGTELTLGGKARLTLSSGEIRAEVAARPEDDPLTVTTPDAEVRVLGTVFRLGAWSQGSCLRVISGRVSLRRLADGQTVEVAGGQHAVLRPGQPLAARDDAIPFDDHRSLGGGTWEVAETPEGTVVRQKNAQAGLNCILFGDAYLRRGLFSGQFRVIAVKSAEEVAVGHVLHYPELDQEPTRRGTGEYNDAFLRKDKRLAETDVWWNFNNLFELRADNSVAVDEVVWREGSPVPLRRTRNVYTEPAFSARTLGGFGLICAGAAVEYRNLRFTGEPTEEEVNLEKRLLARINAVPSGTGIDFAGCRYTGKGKWVVEGAGPETIVKQLNPKAPAGVLFFGRPLYRKGIFAGQFRQIGAGPREAEQGEPPPSRAVPRLRTGIDFSRWGVYAEYDVWAALFMHYPGKEKWPVTFEGVPFFLPKGRAGYDVWVNFISVFELNEDNGLLIHGVKWSERERLPAIWQRVKKTPRPGNWIQKRTHCNVGIGARNTRVYWRNLKLLDAVEADAPPEEEKF